MLAGAVIVDVWLGPGVAISGSYAIAAVLACAFASVRYTAVVAGCAVCLAAASGAWNDNLGSREWTVRLGVATTLGALAVLSALVRVGRERSLSRMTEIAEVAQRALLRAVPTEVGPVKLASRYVSAAEDALVGGDLYEVLETVYGVRVIVADVRGKGLDAVKHAAVVLGGFRRAAATAPSLGCLAVELDEVVAQAVGDEDFVTALLIEAHHDHTLTVVNCGHPPPLLISATGALTELATGSPQLPLGLGTPGQALTATLPADARLLLFTDGLTESRDASGAFFPLGEQGDVLAAGTLEGAVDSLLQRLHHHVGHRLVDDVALVMLARNVSGTP